MEILILSDSHGYEYGLRQALARQVRRPNAVFFLGDGLDDLDVFAGKNLSLYSVEGNCDWFSITKAPKELIIPFEGHTIFATHGHLYGAKETDGALIGRALEIGADIILFGHTHRPLLQVIPAGSELYSLYTAATCRNERTLYLFNPGSLRQGSFGTLTLTPENVLFSHGEL